MDNGCSWKFHSFPGAKKTLRGCAAMVRRFIVALAGAVCGGREEMAQFSDSGYVFEQCKEFQLPRRVSSSYAFDMQASDLSAYCLDKAAEYYAGEQAQYHYVQPSDLKPLSHGKEAKAEIVTRRDLVARIQNLSPGYYQPVIAAGQLHFVPSGDEDVRTARSAASSSELSTGKAHSCRTGRSLDNLKTAKSQKSDLHTAHLGGSESELNAALLHIRYITPADIALLVQVPGFRESLAHFKQERKNRKAAKSSRREGDGVPTAGERFEEMTPAEYIEKLQVQTALEAPSLIDVRTGKSASKDDLRTARNLTEAELCEILGLNPAESGYQPNFIAMDLKTARALSETGLGNDSYGGGGSGTSLRTASGTTRGLETARAYSYSNLNMDRDAQRSRSDLRTGRRLSETSTGQEKSYASLGPKSSKDVTTARTPSMEERQLYEGRNSQMSARASASVTESGLNAKQMLQTPQNFDPRASQSAAGLGAGQGA